MARAQRRAGEGPGGLAIAALLALLLLAAPAAADLTGHGGPVRAIEIAPDGERAISGGFDNSVIRWSLPRASAIDVIRFHDGPVNAVALLPGGVAASAGDDGRIALWGASPDTPLRVLEGHEAKIVALAAAPDGRTLASASWDGTVRLWTVATGEGRIVARHQGNVNGVAFTPDGGALVSAGYDGDVLVTRLADGQSSTVSLGTPLNALRVAADGEIIVAGGDGRLQFLGADGARRGELQAIETPIVALALSPDGYRVAAAGLRGAVAIVDRASRAKLLDLVGPRFPVWSLAFAPDGRTLLTGGADRTIRQWDVATGASQNPIVSARDGEARLMAGNERGAQVFRACIACHTLTADAGNRAGPTLHGVMGRRIGTAEGYNYSPALRGMDIVWSQDTIARLFEIGPTAMTPGTKMPEQIVSDPDDRRALVDWLARVTR